MCGGTPSFFSSESSAYIEYIAILTHYLSEHMYSLSIKSIHSPVGSSAW